MARANGSIRSEVERVKTIDANYGHPQVLLISRMRSVVRAQHALRRHEPDARFELRQACVDLSAACEAVADGLPAPNFRA